MKYVGKILIPDWRPRHQGEYSSMRNRNHRWATIAQDKRIVHDAATISKLPPASMKRLVDVEIQKKTAHLFDEDNLNSLLKIILDGLSRPRGPKKVGAGIIVDDDHAWCDSTITQVKTGQLATLIRLWDIE